MLNAITFYWYRLVVGGAEKRCDVDLSIVKRKIYDAIHGAEEKFYCDISRCVELRSGYVTSQWVSYRITIHNLGLLPVHNSLNKEWKRDEMGWAWEVGGGKMEHYLHIQLHMNWNWIFIVLCKRVGGWIDVHEEMYLLRPAIALPPLMISSKWRIDLFALIKQIQVAFSEHPTWSSFSNKIELLRIHVPI